MRKKNFDDSYHSTSGGSDSDEESTKSPERAVESSSGDGDFVQSEYGTQNSGYGDGDSVKPLYGTKNIIRDHEVRLFIAQVKRQDLDDKTAATILAKYPEVHPNRLAAVVNALEEYHLLNDVQECYLNAAESLNINPNIDTDDLAKFVMVIPGRFAYAANCLKINPDVVPSRLVSLSAAMTKYPNLPDTVFAEILKINPTVNPEKLVKLIDATIAYSGAGSAYNYCKGAAAVLRTNPSINIPKFFQLMNAIDKQFSSAENRILKIDSSAILAVDPNVAPDRMVRMIRAWSDSFKSQLQDAGLDKKTENDLLDKFNGSVATDAVRALKDKPNAEPEKIIQMITQFNQFDLSADTAATILNNNSNIDLDKMYDLMQAFQHADLNCVTAAKIVGVNPEVNIDKLSNLMGAFQGSGLDYVNAAKIMNINRQVDIQKMSTLMLTFRDIGIDHYTAAKILATHPEIVIDKMADVVSKFETAFLEVRDNLPIEMFSQYADITEKFYDTVLMSVVETLKSNPEKSTEDLLKILGAQELPAEQEHKPPVPAQVRSWRSRSEAKSEIQEKDNEKDKFSRPKL